MSFCHLEHCSSTCTARKMEAGVVDQMLSRKRCSLLPTGRPRRNFIFFFPQACSFTYSTEFLLWTTVLKTYVGQTVHKEYF